MSISFAERLTSAQVSNLLLFVIILRSLEEKAYEVVLVG